MIINFVTSALLLFTTFILSSGFSWNIKSSLKITNNLGDGQSVNLSCSTPIANELPDPDFYNLLNGHNKMWRFEYFWTQRYVIWCDIWTDNKKIWFNNVLLHHTDKWGENTEWSIRRDGIYRWQGKKLWWFGQEEWVRGYAV
ncbi:hypothetical protein FRX31_014749 [Thalictrum thalictroides]|uniref:S-protein homolog n=1 Tax=Thalictrum thalictroides TaxID=46969 RepID=A0A7J6WE45_THATH|nr:hypothetical protein FRX31_014749 [Thalictrum thalictroides]